jgi:hypothetical protein
VKTTELNENPRNGPVADTTSQPDGHDLDIRGLMCSGDVWGSDSNNNNNIYKLQLGCHPVAVVI